MIRTAPRLALLAALSSLTACYDYGRYHRYYGDDDARSVSIEVEVFDPNTSQVWQDVDVRIVEALVEESGVNRVNPNPTDTIRTDRDGLAFFSAHRVGDADVGFVRSSSGRALLERASSRDEAVVTLEVSAANFTSVMRDVRITWSRPNAFVSIPFE